LVQEQKIIKLEWDIKTVKNVATFEGHKGSIVDMIFSENGYYLITSSEDQIIKLWDLRTPKNLHSLKLDVAPTSIDIDYSGKYLTVGVGNEIRIFTISGKSFDHVITLDDHTALVTDVKFGSDANSLASCSMDRTIKFFTLN